MYIKLKKWQLILIWSATTVVIVAIGIRLFLSARAPYTPREIPEQVRIPKDLSLSGIVLPSPSPESPERKNFYGKLLEKKDASLTIQEIVPPTRADQEPTSGITHTIAVTPDTEYSVQQEIKTDSGQTIFQQKSGSFAQLKPGWYVYIERDAGSAYQRARRITASHASPF